MLQRQSLICATLWNYQKNFENNILPQPIVGDTTLIVGSWAWPLALYQRGSGLPKKFIAGKIFLPEFATSPLNISKCGLFPQNFTFPDPTGKGQKPWKRHKICNWKTIKISLSNLAYVSPIPKYQKDWSQMIIRLILLYKGADMLVSWPWPFIRGIIFVTMRYINGYLHFTFTFSSARFHSSPNWPTMCRVGR